MLKILMDKIIQEIQNTPGANTAAKFPGILDAKVRKYVSNPQEVERGKSEVAREMIRIRRTSTMEEAS